MNIKITRNGIALINDKIEDLKLKLKQIREEKNIAYHNSGDTWHDNPYFNKLEQEEKVENINILKLENILATAEVVEWEKRNTQVIEIGSIVQCRCDYTGFVEDVVYEIVGYGESDFDHGKISYETPVGQQLIGLTLGEEKDIETPGGSVKYKIVKLYSSWDEVEVD